MKNQLNIMKVFYLCLLCVFIIGISHQTQANDYNCQNLPQRQHNYVYDYENLLSNNQKIDLEKKIKAFVAESTEFEEIVVLCIKTPDCKLSTFGTSIGKKWRLGKTSIVIIVTKDGMSSVSPGTAVKNKITNTELKDIYTKSLEPYARKAQYYKAIDMFISKYIELPKLKESQKRTESEYFQKQELLQKQKSKKQTRNLLFIFGFLFLSIVFAVWIYFKYKIIYPYKSLAKTEIELKKKTQGKLNIKVFDMEMSDQKDQRILEINRMNELNKELEQLINSLGLFVSKKQSNYIKDEIEKRRLISNKLSQKIGQAIK